MRLWVIGVVLAGCALGQTAPDTAAGRKIFESQCALCHGQTGGGGRGPALNRPKLDKAPDDEALRKLISEGRRRHARRLAIASRRSGQRGGLCPLSGRVAAGDGARRCGARRARLRGQGLRGLPHGGRRQAQGFGPELTAIGARRNAAFLRQTILKPAATLPDGFLYVSASPPAGASGPRHPGQRRFVHHPTARCRRHVTTASASRELKELRRLEGRNSHAVVRGHRSAVRLSTIWWPTWPA